MADVADVAAFLLSDARCQPPACAHARQRGACCVPLILPSLARIRYYDASILIAPFSCAVFVSLFCHGAAAQAAVAFAASVAAPARPAARLSSVLFIDFFAILHALHILPPAAITFRCLFRFRCWHTPLMPFADAIRPYVARPRSFDHPRRKIKSARRRFCAFNQMSISDPFRPL